MIEEAESWGVPYRGHMQHQQKLASRGNICRCLRCGLKLNPSEPQKWLRLVGFTAGRVAPQSLIGGDIGVVIEACPFCSAHYYMHVDKKYLKPNHV